VTPCCLVHKANVSKGPAASVFRVNCPLLATFFIRAESVFLTEDGAALSFETLVPVTLHDVTSHAISIFKSPFFMTITGKIQIHVLGVTLCAMTGRWVPGIRPVRRHKHLVDEDSVCSKRHGLQYFKSTQNPQNMHPNDHNSLKSHISFISHCWQN